MNIIDATPPPNADERRAEQLREYAESKPDGFKNHEAEAEFGWDRVQFNTATRVLRLMLGDADEIAFICEPDGWMNAWTYKLVGTTEDASPWTKNRVQDSKSRLVTMQATATALVRGTDGRTPEGKEARIIERHTTRALEDL